MTHQSQTQSITQQHLQLWIYLLPVVGVVPAIWTLYRTKNNLHSSWSDRPKHHASLRQQQLSRLSVNLGLAWLGSYALFTLSAGNTSEILSFRLLYANAIITTGYFVTCTYLMSRLGKKKIFARKEFY